MKEWIIIYLPYLLSLITLYNMFLAGNKSKYTWIIWLINQALWLVWILLTESYWLLPMNIGLWVIYYRNHLKWNK